MNTDWWNTPGRPAARIANPEAPPQMRVAQRNWRAPARVVLDSVLQLYSAGLLDKAVADRPDLKRFTDALVLAGNMTITDGHLVPKIDPNTGWWAPLDAANPDTNQQ